MCTSRTGSGCDRGRNRRVGCQSKVTVTPRAMFGRSLHQRACYALIFDTLFFLAFVAQRQGVFHIFTFSGRLI
jgi:hypothetical protein